ncbi:MAG: tyrosine-type recombinase/integrase [Desulfobulbaceae bacterium]|nr:tyrosine-type recombinase/integrase [Desulfobulbaceae bacterium]
MTTGGKWWRFKYRFGGKEKLLSLGTYPQVSLKDAREKRDDAKKLLRNHADPAAERQAVKQAESGKGSFEAVAGEWFSKFSQSWVPRHADTIQQRLDNHILPNLGQRQINEVTAPVLLAVLRKIEAQGYIETAHRVKQICGQIFRYAIATGRAERDPAADLKGALPPAKSKRMASIIDPKGVGGLLRAIDDYKGSIVTQCALQLGALTFVRPGELRRAEWEEIDLDAAEWRIPAEKMKMKSPHIVPLSKQAVSVLNKIQPLTGQGRYVFPSERTRARPMSENTVNAALRRMGYTKEEVTGHGFRSMASTLLHELGWRSEVIERQLAHQERNKVKAAYNHAEHLAERKKMMQAWADYLEGIKAGAKIIPIRAAG